jgi:ABC-2 type transport system ATP-binding protein
LSFTVRPGRVTGFLGPNGAGKSTTMRMVLGVDRPSAGTVKVNGQAYRDLRAPLRRQVGALIDPQAVDPKRSAAGHLAWLAASNGIDRRRVDEVLGVVGLADVSGRRAGGFSLGMRQRLGLAAALLGDPETLLFDEPINGLDPEGILWLRGLLRSLADEGRTVFLSSHLMSEMAQTADHLVVIGHGHLIADAPASEVIRDHGRTTVRVRALDHQDDLTDVVDAHGARTETTPDGLLVVTGLDAAAIGRIALAKGIALAELTPQAASLEEAFMDLTRHDTDHRSAMVPAGRGA